MKKIILGSLAVMLIMAGCKKKDDSSPSNSIQTNLQSTSWKVTYYQNNGNDETSDFSGYSFSFGSGNTVSATNGSGTTNGTWSTGTDDSSKKLIISFPAVSPLDELNEDWDVLQQSSVLIKLKHVSGGNGGIHYLNFEKL